MLLYHLKEIRINKRFASKDCDKVDSHLLTLSEDPLDQFIRKLWFGPISKGVASFAAEVTVERR
jgi:hypothetical protein